MRKRAVWILLLICVSAISIAQETTAVNNQKDENNRKQGYWVIKNENNKFPTYAEGQKVEEGKYSSSRKTGLWKAYHPNGKLKSEIYYENGMPRGKYKLYYENGKLEEEGNWDRTKNTGDFKRYYSNGQLMQDFKFTEAGLRTGPQKYFYENGNKRLEGTWQNGKESGSIVEYYENGDVSAKKNFKEGKLDVNSLEVYAAKKPNKVAHEGRDMVVKAEKDENPNQGGFNGNGYRKLYNDNMQIVKDGTFVNYRLMEGKLYRYDENGLLQQILIFKNGRYIGNGVIEESLQ